eukprot:1480097-Rhodomonas_salina.1
MLANTCLTVEPSGSSGNNAFVNPLEGDVDASLPARAPFFTHNGGGASAPVPLPHHGGPEHPRPHPSGPDDVNKHIKKNVPMRLVCRRQQPCNSGSVRVLFRAP